MSVDEGSRWESTMDALARLRPAFPGSITAGNASPTPTAPQQWFTTTRGRVRIEGWQVLAVVRSVGQVVGPDASSHAQPARAIARALDREGWSTADLNVIEIKEAFGAVVAQSVRELGLPAIT